MRVFEGAYDQNVQGYLIKGSSIPEHQPRRHRIGKRSDAKLDSVS